jgi:hypothetical protein
MLDPGHMAFYGCHWPVSQRELNGRLGRVLAGKAIFDLKFGSFALYHHQGDKGPGRGIEGIGS